MLLLDKDSSIKRWERCTLLGISYIRADGKKGHYYPDFIVEREDGTKEIHEIKGDHLLGNKNTERKLEAGEEFCRKRGMIFKVITRGK